MVFGGGGGGGFYFFIQFTLDVLVKHQHLVISIPFPCTALFALMIKTSDDLPNV